MKFVHILIDYDNAKDRPERSQADVALNLSVLCNCLAAQVHALVPDSQELLLRLYGGWMTIGSQYSQRAHWLLAEISNFRRKIGPLRLKPSMVTALVIPPDLILLGTYQQDEQKMVDEMITADAIELAHETDTSIGIASDDDDFVPAALAAAHLRSKRNPLLLLRRRKLRGDAPNDSMLCDSNVIVSHY